MKLEPDNALALWAGAIALRLRSWNASPTLDAVQREQSLLAKRFPAANVSAALTGIGESVTDGNRELLRALAAMSEVNGADKALAEAAGFFRDVMRLQPAGSRFAGGRRPFALKDLADPALEVHSFAGAAPRNYVRADATILDDVGDKLTRHHEIDARTMDVKVSDGIVTLAGTAANRHVKWLAEALCIDCAGVVDVDNRLQVPRSNAGAAQPGHRAVIDDADVRGALPKGNHAGVNGKHEARGAAKDMHKAPVVRKGAAVRARKTPKRR